MVESQWEAASPWATAPGHAPWPYFTRRRYRKSQVRLALIGLLIVPAAASASSTLGLPAAFLAASLGAAGGIALGLWSWRRTRARFQVGAPEFRFSGYVPILFMVLLVLAMVALLAISLLIALPLVLPPSSDALLQAEKVLLVLLFSMGAAMWTTRVASVARYEKSKSTVLIEEVWGRSKFNLREVRILELPPSRSRG